jgi:FKBP-type peptidyl-prolyl cis-trans isomerase FklB
MDQFSYSLGVVLAQNLTNQGISEFNPSDLAAGLEDVVKNNSLRVNAQEADQIIQNYLKENASKQHGAIVKEGQQFLAENAKRSEVIVLESGLQYEVLREGIGANPKPTDKVTTHYHGTLIDGTVFDSSVDRGEPATFPVNGVIAGWVEALQLMKPGSKFRLYVPYDLAYGEQGAGQLIKPFASLIFEVELLEIL